MDLLLVQQVLCGNTAVTKVRHQLPTLGQQLVNGLGIIESMSQTCLQPMGSTHFTGPVQKASTCDHIGSFIVHHCRDLRQDAKLRSNGLYVLTDVGGGVAAIHRSGSQDVALQIPRAVKEVHGVGGKRTDCLGGPRISGNGNGWSLFQKSAQLSLSLLVVLSNYCGHVGLRWHGVPRLQVLQQTLQSAVIQDAQGPHVG